MGYWLGNRKNNEKGKIRELYYQKIFTNNILLSVVINLFFLLLILLFCDIKYEVSDDFVMAAIMSGAFGDLPNPHLIFVNVIVGYLLKPFYVIIPKISWYFVLQIFLIFVSSCIVVYLLFEKMDKPRAMMLSLVFILFFANDAYILVQFTKTAMLAIMAGSLLFIWALFNSRSIWNILFGAIICAMGTLIRFADIYLVGGFLLFILGFEFMQLYLKEGWRGFWNRHFLKIVVSGSILIGTAFCLKGVDGYIYKIDEEYKWFSEYNSARARVVDSAWYDYWEYEDELSAIGVSENDYYMMKTWNFADNEVFSLEKMQETAKIIADHHSNKEVMGEEIINRLQSREYMKYPVFLACIMLLGLGIFLNYSNWWAMLISVGIGEMYLIYFCYRERMLYRVEYAIFLGVFLCGIYFWNYFGHEEKEFIEKEKRRNICAIVSMLCMAVHFILYVPDQTYKAVTSENRANYISNTFSSSWDYGAQKYRKVVNKEKPVNHLLDEFASNKDKFYLMDFESTIQILYYEWCPWESLPVGKFDNFVYMAGVTTNYPDVNALLEKRGISDPLKALVNDDIYLVDNCRLEVKLNFLREHYYPNATAELYKEIDGYQIWKFYEN